MEIYIKSVPYSNKILKDNIDGGRILDVGGAACWQRGNVLAELGSEFFIADPAELNSSLTDKAHHIQQCIEEVEVSQWGKFDNIVMSNVLEHLDQPLAALVQASTLLKDDGRLHILTPNCESLNRRVGVQMGVMESIRTIPQNEIAIGHVQTFNVSDMRHLLQQSGFTVSACRGVFLKPVPTPEMIQWPEERIKAFFELGAVMPPELCHEVYFRANF